MIDTSSWKEFRVGELFSCETTLGIPSKNDLADGNINYITRSAIDNGFSGTCGNEDHKNKGNCITIGAEGFVAFWQSDDFVAGNKVYALRHPNMNEINGLFVCSALNALSDRYSFADARVLDKIKVEIIKLPATSDGQPDWDYMESYMKAVMEESEKSLENLRKADDTKHLIDVSGWGEFRVGDLFDMSLSKDDIQPKSIIEGNIPLISSGKTNNGIVAYIQDDKATIQKANTITVDMFGKAFYQVNPYYCVSHGRVNILTSKFDMNEYIGMFVAIAIEKVSNEKYEFDSMCTGTKLAEDIIRLPITSTGEPDWQYMEDYMRRIMDKSEQIISDLQIGA